MKLIFVIIMHSITESIVLHQLPLCFCIQAIKTLRFPLSNKNTTAASAEIQHRKHCKKLFGKFYKESFTLKR